ncbi:uncharacterized protein LAESUDRAFT_738942 [Laetiporus sulphureus 93-53]|uniref:SNF2 family DNA-dependent ATPase n=1 Tax=Laetiporus sulphureus 93-53 TaxID=1314785 RepID=A0A165C011_9APHY|nr:uncharacterized protein LAESUDRAFT_738942 [Laetiporus sulphureus 93-53]KZT01956.1 hypothetical protein LAESUDRAFT_738942 [Laetiporus sulphureus 93-53]
MDKVKVKHGRRLSAKADAANQEATNAANERPTSGTAKKRTRGDAATEVEQATKRVKVEAEESADANVAAKDERAFEQPALITGATLRDYQLEGVAWMAGLYQSGISGILADEMGLGKTLQTIAFHAFLRERSTAPFLVVCPLSVLSNWVEEFRRFAPTIPVVMYHGSPEERAELRRTAMVFSEEDMKYQNKMFGRAQASPPPAAAPDPKAASTKSRASSRGSAGSKKKSQKQSVKARTKKGQAPWKSSRLSGRHQEVTEFDSEDEDEEDLSTARKTRRRTPQVKAEQDEENTPSEPTEHKLPPHQRTNFPVVVTTYEMIIRDRAQLAEYYWGFIVVDEGHRLKNMDCKLMHEIKKLNAAARMVLTGTPLHNNLSELWALLNFVLPDLFSDLEAFEEWFNLPMLQATLSASRSSQLIHSLHALLRPFLLRRLKADVEANLPPKKEYVLYAPLSERQREVYDAIVKGGLRALLVKEASQRKERKGKVASLKTPETDEEEEVPLYIQNKKKRHPQTRQSKRRNYDVDGDDDEYFTKLQSGALDGTKQKERVQSADEIGREWQRKITLKKVNNMKLQNTVMQLRKICSHPFLFDWPIDPDTQQPALNEELVSTSGKMMILERLLEELFRRKHKVLLFSQFTTMLDIIEDWAIEFKGWNICRIDGSTSMVERRDEVSRFQNGGDAPDAPQLFLLSTRAGGLGLNLVAADTVIFYDQDWNPQMDLQAQDRAHRIGQTKPVLIFRLVSAHTIETKIMQRATEKRKLEALVIAKGQFKTPSLAASRSRPERIAEMAAALLELEGEQIRVVPDNAAGKASVISDRELDMLLDRSPEVFSGRGKGWTSAEKVDADGAKAGTAEKAAFAVYEAPVDETGDVLAGMLDGREEEEEEGEE